MNKPVGTFWCNHFFTTSDGELHTADVLSGYAPRTDLEEPPRSEPIVNVEWDDTDHVTLYCRQTDDGLFYFGLTKDAVVQILMAKGYTLERAEEILSIN